jgi:hypothetical protein
VTKHVGQASLATALESPEILTTEAPDCDYVVGWIWPEVGQIWEVTRAPP